MAPGIRPQGFTHERYRAAGLRVSQPPDVPKSKVFRDCLDDAGPSICDGLLRDSHTDGCDAAW